MMNPIEWMALIVIALGLVKLLVVLVEPKKWLALVEWIYGSPCVTTIVSVVLAGVTLMYLLTVMSIVHVMAVTLFVSLLFLMSFAQYPEVVLKMARSIFKEKNVLARGWLPTVIWVGLMLWALKELFL